MRTQVGGSLKRRHSVGKKREGKLRQHSFCGRNIASRILPFLLILSGFPAPRCGAAVYPSNGQLANIQGIHDHLAHNGDTITLPSGTFRWTARLNITKGITLQGQTTITGAGTNSPIVDDVTIIKDDTLRTGQLKGIIRVDIDSTQSFRMTGITFTHGVTTVSPTTDGAIELKGHGAAPVYNYRIDHCHFDTIYQPYLFLIDGWNFGVIDHNVFHQWGGSIAFHIYHDQYGGAAQINGNGSWADYPWFGTDKFFFIEDNSIYRNGQGATDALFGGRAVVRHNYFHDAIITNHGTEAGAGRGGREFEVYDNVFDMTVPGQSGIRSGTILIHDNVYLGLEVPADIVCNLANYREGPARPDPVWGIADGTGVWDANDTEGNGTFVEGHPPFLFASGIAATASTPSGFGYVFRVSGNPHWTTNRWAGYSIKNLNLPLAYGSYIISNTANTITYFRYNGADTGGYYLNFAVGNFFQIHRVLAMMDQSGSGKGDQLAGAQNPINTVTGVASYNHQAAEPCYSWNNVYTPNGHEMGFSSVYPTAAANIQYFNLGGGFPQDTTPSQVSSKYVAALNGVDYTGTYIYPHPLTLRP